MAQLPHIGNGTPLYPKWEMLRHELKDDMTHSNMTPTEALNVSTYMTRLASECAALAAGMIADELEDLKRELKESEGW